MFSALAMTNFVIRTTFQFLSGIASSFVMFSYRGMKLDFDLNPFPNKPSFLCDYSTSLLKLLWEKETLLLSSNVSFSHSVFYLFEELAAIFIRFEIVICKLFHFGRVKNLSFGKGPNSIFFSRKLKHVSSAVCFNLNQSKILSSVNPVPKINELTLSKTTSY